MIAISFNRNTLQQTSNLLNAIALPPRKRARLLKRVAKNIVTVSKSNITKQQTPDGQKWAKRKKGRVKRKAKMLLGLRKHIVVSHRSDENHAEVGLKKGNYRAHAGIVGNQHSKGSTRTVNADRAHNKKAEKTGCTRAQAKTLKALGYKIYARRMTPNAPRGKRKVPTVKFMVEHFAYEEVQGAFAALREAGSIPSGKSSWDIKTPSRRFLGANKEKTDNAWARAFQSMNYGRRR